MRVYSFLLIFALWALSTQAQTQQIQANKAELINQLIAQSGISLLSAQAEQVVDLFSFTQLLDKKQKAQAKAQIGAMFAYHVIHKSATKALEEKNEKQLKQWQSALSYKQLVKLYELEKKAINQQFSNTYNEYMLALKTKAPRDSRVEKITKLVDSSKRYSWLWMVRKSSFDALAKKYGKPAINLSAKRLKKRFIHFYLYACRHLSDKEIDEIIAAYDKEEVKKWLAVMTTSLEKSL